MEIKKVSKEEGYLVTDLFDQYRVFYKQSSDIDLAKEFIQARLDNNESVIFVALIKDQNEVIPIGFTQLYPKYSSARAIKNWILNDLFVAPKYRQQMVGEKLIKTAMEFAQGSRAKFVELSTAVDNFTAQGLYEKIGFRKQQPETEFFTYRIDVE